MYLESEHDACPMEMYDFLLKIIFHTFSIKVLDSFYDKREMLDGIISSSVLNGTLNLMLKVITNNRFVINL